MPPKTLRLKGWLLAELSARALAEGGAEAGGAGREPDRSQGARGRFRGDSGEEAGYPAAGFLTFSLALRARWLAPSNSRMME